MKPYYRLLEDDSLARWGLPFEVRVAEIADLSDIVYLIDNEFTKEGFGFVNRQQIKSEVRKSRVLVALKYRELVGVRIGLGTVWNLVVAKAHRGENVGRRLMEYLRPHTVRVKSDPIGHLSKKQKEAFRDPSGFYETLGFRLWGKAYPRNFWQRGKDGKAQFHKIGQTLHIKVYKDPKVVMEL